MARFSRLEVLNAMVESGLVPVFYHSDLDVAKHVVDARARGGRGCSSLLIGGNLHCQCLVSWHSM
jgi:hypothetical protein